MLCSFPANNSHNPTQYMFASDSPNEILSPVFLIGYSLSSHRFLANNKWDVTTAKFVIKSLFPTAKTHFRVFGFIDDEDNLLPLCVLTHGRPSLNSHFHFSILPSLYIFISLLGLRHVPFSISETTVFIQSLTNSQLFYHIDHRPGFHPSFCSPKFSLLTSQQLAFM